VYVEGGGKRGEEDEHACTSDNELQSWENCSFLSALISHIIITHGHCTASVLPAFPSRCSLPSRHKSSSQESPSY